MRKTDAWLVPERRVHHMADLEEARAVFSGIYSESKLEPSRGLAFSCELKVIACGSIHFVHGLWPTGGRCTIPRVLGRYRRELRGPLVFNVALNPTSAAGVGPILKLFAEGLELPSISSFFVASLRARS